MQKNMSQSDLAEALEVPRQSISKWETDSSVPELDKLVRLSECFGVTLDELTGAVNYTSDGKRLPFESGKREKQTASRKRRLGRGSGPSQTPF